MAEDAGPTIAGDLSSSSRVSSSFVKIGDRTRFTVEIKPGETTIVSWKKLSKDVTKAQRSHSLSAPEPPVNAHPSLESRLAPVQGKPAADELNDVPVPNRLNSVIEKIERLYMGKDSDEEDMDGIPDDDQYDTEDSFIDDAELDEYFEVDKSKTKHDGYFVNRGALEKINEPLQLTNQQSRKRRRKEILKGNGDNGHNNHPDKPMKVGKKHAGKSALSVGTNILHNTQVQSHSNASRTWVANGDTCSSLTESSDKQKTAVLLDGNPISIVKENSTESERVTQQKHKSTVHEKLDLNLPEGKQTVHQAKTSLGHKKEASNLKPKANSLDKAIRELERIVAESRPPTVDVQDADASPSIKRRLPREIKLKLAKVARLANASNGKVSNELLNHLMGILGHLCQLRTLKRHLKVMMTTSLSAKQEKDDKFQQIKKEVVELIKGRFPSLISLGDEQQCGGSGDAQNSVNSDKALKGQHCIDAMLEDKICDLYDIFVDGLDEDVAPQLRKLYAELAELWPRGVMNNHGIKQAICRAKERKWPPNQKAKDQDKIKRKKPVAAKEDDKINVESTSLQFQHVDSRLATDPGTASVAQQGMFIPSTTSSAAAVSVPPPSANVPNFEQSKGESLKSTVNDIGIADGVIVKNTVKKRKGTLGGDPSISNQSYSHQGDDRKQTKHDGAAALLGTPP